MNLITLVGEVRLTMDEFDYDGWKSKVTTRQSTSVIKFIVNIKSGWKIHSTQKGAHLFVPKI